VSPLLYVVFFLFICLAVYAVLSAREDGRRRIRQRLAYLTSGELARAPGSSEEPLRRASLARRLISLVWDGGKRKFSRRLRADQANKIEAALLRGGSPFHMGPADFRMLQMAAMAALAAGFAGYGLLLDAGPWATILLAGAGLGAGWLLPGYYLRLKTASRLRQALRELPDSLDLLTVSLEAGLGFDAALGKLVAYKDGVLAQEFGRFLEEMRLGATRKEALIGIRDRLPLDDVKVLVGSILQAEKLGIGIVQVMRAQSLDVRARRKQRAEEKAMKAPVKMLFPLIFFIFPTLFIVLLGPAAIQLVGAFGGSR